MTQINLSDKPKFVSRLILDTDNGSPEQPDLVTSALVNGPHVIQVSPVPATSTIQIQAKTHIDANWAVIAEITDESEDTLYFFDTRMNYVQVKQTVGADAITAYAQGG